MKKNTRLIFFSLSLLFISFNSKCQVLFRALSTNGTITGTSIIVNKPTGTTLGDVMIANIATNGNNIISTSPGWTLLKSSQLGSTTTFATVLYKIVNSSDNVSSNYTFSLGTGATGGSAGILTFSGADTTRAIDTISPSISIGNSKFVSATSISTLTPKTAILMLGQVAGSATTANYWNNSFWKATSPATLTELYDQSGNNTSVAAAWASKLTLGDTGIGSDSLNAVSRWGSILIALRSCAPRIINQPTASSSVCVNATAPTLSISAIAMGNITYQWYTNNTPSVTSGTAIAGANSASYTSPNVTLTSGNYYYYAIVTGSCGKDTSSIALITVNPSNTITLSSAAGTNNQTRCINTAITNITYATTGATGATVTGLPAGVTGTWAANVFTISGTPTAAGTFNYTVTMTGGCIAGTNTATGTIIVSANNTITLSSAAGTNNQTRCINTAITNITYTTTGATGATVTGLPAGVTGTWAANVFTISGTPTAAGTFNYTVTMTGGCIAGTNTATGTIIVSANNTITLSSAAGTNNQTPCINTAITNITYATIGATGATVTGLPAGVTGTWAANVFTISGTPTAAGTFNYTVTMTGGCIAGTNTATGTIIVSANNTITLSSAAGTNNQTPCINTAITNITYATTGATGATVTGLPAGVTGTWATNVFTISGTPSAAGTFNYTVTMTGGCIAGTNTATGTIIVSANNTITLSSAAGTNNQTRCINTAITNITYTTTGATGATVTGLPAGVTGTWAANVFTISGTPTAAGTFNYTVTMTGGCIAGTNTATGTIIVSANNTITLSSAAGTNNQTRCINTAITNITYTTTGATGATVTGLPAGVTGTWAANVFTISGTPTAAGTFNYTVTMTGGCIAGTNTTTGTIIVSANNTITLSSAAGTNNQTRCINTAITNITYTTTGATGATVTGLPAGVTGTWAANVFTISGTPTAAGTFNYTVTMTGACIAGTNTATGTIIVSANNTITLSSAAGTNNQTRCINTAITNITYTTTGATGATVTGLPAGVTGTWAANVFTVRGTPTTAGTFNYTITMAGGCIGGTNTATGTIIVTANNTITLSSVAGTNNQTRCINTAITNITYATTSATGATVTGLPAGVAGTWTANVFTISGTPTVAGTFNYTVTMTGGCITASNTATGTITVTSANTITTQPPASISLCLGGTLSIPVIASGSNTFQWKKNGIDIVGATASTYTKANVSIADTGTYSVSVTNSCGIASSQNCVFRIISGISVNIIADYCAAPNRIKLSAIVNPSTGNVNSFTYSWSNGGIRDTTYVNLAGTYSVTVTPTAATIGTTGCSGSATASLPVSQELVYNGNFNLGNVGFACPPLFGAAYQYFEDSVNYQRELSLPGRYGVGFNANNYNAGYQGKDHTTRTGKFMIVRGYSFIKPMVWQDTVTVMPNTTYYFSGWAMGVDSSSIVNYPILKFMVNGNQVGTPMVLPPHGTSPNAPDNWLRFYMTWNSGTSTRAIFSIYDSTATFRGNAFGLDDISIGPLSTFISLASSEVTDTQTVCINTPIQPISFFVGSGGAPSVSGLPAGVSYSYNGYQLTISGSPSISGTFNYTISTSGCSVKTFNGQIKSQSQNVILTSPTGTNNQSICIGNAITVITYNLIGTNATPTVTGLPSGVNFIFNSGTLSISGTPALPGIYNYSITTSGGNCAGSSVVNGSINVVALPVVSISVDSCLIAGRLVLKAVLQTPGTYTYLWNTGATSDTLSVNTSGTYSVQVTNSTGCRSSNSIIISIGLVQTSAPATSIQNACLSTPIIPIIYSAGGNFISYNATGLPPGVTANFAGGIITISGIPTQLGTFNYTLNYTGSLCRNDLPVTYTRTGVITVNSNPTVSITADFCAINNKVRLTAIPVPAGTYSYLWSSGSVSDTAQVNTAGIFNVTVTNSSGCRATASYQVNTELSINGNFSLGNTGFVSVATGNLPAYTFVPDSANFQGELIPPGLYSVDTNANNFNVNYWGRGRPNRTGKFMIIHSYPNTAIPIPGPPQPSQEPIMWQQTLPVQTNTTYYFSAWAMGLDSSGDYASLKFMINGNQVGNNLNLTAHGLNANAPDNWRRFYTTWNSGNNTTATFSIQNQPSSTNLFAGNAIGLDDISIGRITPYISLTSNPITDTQIVCINTPIQPTTFSYGSGGSPTVTGLPTGVVMNVTNSTLTISGTPTVAGTYNYTISTVGCSVSRFFGQIIVQSTNLVLTSAATTNNQAVCINSPITNIVYNAVASVTALTVSGLPAGVSHTFNSGILTISGTPTISGIFNYTITISGGGCSTTTSYTGTINSKARPAVNITIDYCTLPGKALLKAIPTPSGTHTFLWSTGRNTDTCSVVTSGTYTVTVTNSIGCQTVTSINVVLGINVTSGTNSNNPNICLGDTVRRITFATGSNITAVNITGLPGGVNFTYSSNTITIFGTPVASGTFNYTITPTVSCGAVSPLNGVIKVFEKPSVVIKSSYCAIPGKIKLTAIVTPAGTYTYLWSNGGNRDTTSVNSAGTYSVTVTNSNGCSRTVSITAGFELAVNGNFNAGNTGFNTPLLFNQQYQYIADSPNVQTELITPGLYGIGNNANNYNASYQGRDHTSGNGNFMIVHGFPFLQVPAWEKTITVSPNTLYYFSAWAQGLDSLNNNPILKFTVNGNQMGANLALTNHGQSPTSPDNWTRFYATWNSGTATLASFAITDVQTFSLGKSFGLDDISIGALGPFISLVSNPSTDTQTVCLNTPITPVNLAIGLDSLPPVVTGLPQGVTSSFNGYNLIISGAPTSLGIFNYTVAISGCSPKTFYGQIISQGQSLVLNSAPNSNLQTICTGNSINNIIYNAGGNVSASAVNIVGLPPGVTYNISTGIITISGTPTLTGVYNYVLTVTGGICSGTSTTVSANGTINVIATPTIQITSDYCSQPGRVKLKAIPNPTGTYTYLWNNGATTDTTTVDLVGNYTITITNSNGCRVSSSISVSNELVTNWNFNLGNAGFITTPTGAQRYIYVPDSANYRRELYLPGRYGIGTNANNYHDLYWGHDHTTGTGNFMIVHGYAFAAPILWQDTVQVTPNTDYYFSAWGMSLNSLGFNGRLKFSINNTQVGNILSLPNRGNADTSIDNWTRFYTTWNSGTATSAVLSITNTQTSFLGNSFGIDDISFASMAPFITLVSSPSTDTQTVCINTNISTVALTVGSGGGVNVVGLPPGVSYTYDGYNLLISGAPTVLGTFNYTISLTSNCLARTFTGQIVSRGQTLTLTSNQATSNQTICLRSPINSIVLQSTGNISNANASGLPAGLVTSYNQGVFTISGIPTQSGIFNYTVTATGPFCSPALFSGIITVNTSPTASITASPTNTISCSNLAITLTASGGSAYSWNNGLGSNASISVTNAGLYTVTVSNSFSCVDSAYINIINSIPPNVSTWLGINSNWNDPINWCGGLPTPTRNVLLPGGLSAYPVINNTASCANITINAGTTIVIDSAATFFIYGNLISNGTVTNNGTISLTGSINQSFPGPGIISKMNILQINNAAGVTLNKSIEINRELRPSLGILNLDNYDITIKSTNTLTAYISSIGINAGFSYGSGRFVVERYIPTGAGIGQHGKSWQFITAPVRGNQTVKQSWQENAAFPNQNPNPGYGTQITSEIPNATLLGFDMRSAAPSMKVYDTASNSFFGIPNTLNYPIQSDKGYMIFIRGNRNDTSFTQIAEPATLRARGTIYGRGVDAPSNIIIPSGSYQSIGNPYPSAIDFSNTNGVVFDRGVTVDNTFYVWDPTLTGTNGLGGYQTISSINNWVPVPGGTFNYPAGIPSPVIQSGQAFFMHANGSGGTVSFNETAKTNVSSNTFRENYVNHSNNSENQIFESSLYMVVNGNNKLADGNLLVGGDAFSDELSPTDAPKLNNTAESFSLRKKGKSHSIITCPTLQQNDTIFYSFSGLRTGNYVMTFKPQNLEAAGLVPYLIDKHLQTRTLLSFADTSYHYFSVISNSPSAASDRFMIVMEPAITLPIRFTQASAQRIDKNNVQITWNTENEINIDHFEIERSEDRRYFSTIMQNNQPTNYEAANHYQIYDNAAPESETYYRIKAVCVNGTYYYSDVARVIAFSLKKQINIYPNPVTENKINLLFQNYPRGEYKLDLYTISGQKICTQYVLVSSPYQSFTMPLTFKLTSNDYMLKCSIDGKHMETKKIFIGQ